MIARTIRPKGTPKPIPILADGSRPGDAVADEGLLVGVVDNVGIGVDVVTDAEVGVGVVADAGIEVDVDAGAAGIKVDVVGEF